MSPTSHAGNPVLASMYSDTFSIVGVEKTAAGVWVHQRWYCETGSVAQQPKLNDSSRECPSS